MKSIERFAITLTIAAKVSAEQGYVISRANRAENKGHVNHLMTLIQVNRNQPPYPAEIMRANLINYSKPLLGPPLNKMRPRRPVPSRIGLHQKFIGDRVHT